MTLERKREEAGCSATSTWCCGDSTGPEILATLDVRPATATLTAIGGTVQFRAFSLDSDGNVTGGGGLGYIWSSSHPNVATVDWETGLATAVANGSTMISAGTPSLIGGQSGSATLTVAAP